MTIEYVLYPGWVKSANDGQEHFISAQRLADLYDIPLHLCFVVHYGFPIPEELRNLPRLRPRFDGNYKL